MYSFLASSLSLVKPSEQDEGNDETSFISSINETLQRHRKWYGKGGLLELASVQFHLVTNHSNFLRPMLQYAENPFEEIDNEGGSNTTAPLRKFQMIASDQDRWLRLAHASLQTLAILLDCPSNTDWFLREGRPRRLLRILFPVTSPIYFSQSQLTRSEKNTAPMDSEGPTGTPGLKALEAVKQLQLGVLWTLVRHTTPPFFSFFFFKQFF